MKDLVADLVLPTLHSRTAGILSIWFIRSVSCVRQRTAVYRTFWCPDVRRRSSFRISHMCTTMIQTLAKLPAPFSFAVHCLMLDPKGCPKQNLLWACWDIITSHSNVLNLAQEHDWKSLVFNIEMSYGIQAECIRHTCVRRYRIAQL